MTGPEHYLEAESLLKRAWAAHLPNRLRWSQRHAELQYLLRAQAHATLALAAATAMAAATDEDLGTTGMADIDFDEWDAACGKQP